jgi:hypothetical protein
MGKKNGKLTNGVVVEETIKPSAINEDTATVHNPQSPAHITLSRYTSTARREIGIIPTIHNRKHDTGVRIRLPVCGLSLDLTRKDVLCVGELVLIQRVMFNCGANHPDCTRCGCAIETAACVHSDLRHFWIFDVVVCGPEPVVLHIQSCG